MENESSFDIGSAMDGVASSMGIGPKDEEAPVVEAKVEAVAEADPKVAVADPKAADPKVEAKPDPKTVVDPKTAIADPAAPVVRAAPASFPKDKADIWAKMPPEAQDFYLLREQQMLQGLEQYKEHNAFGKQVKEAYAPYKAMLTAQGVDEVKATQYLLNAYYRLTNGSPEQRQAAFQNMGVSFGILAPGEQKEIDPALRELQERQTRMESALTQKAQREFTETRTRVGAEVDSFAKDAPYFDEVSADIVNLINAAHARGENPDLKSMYDQAVWANPVTRQKELARTQQENEKALREKSAQEAEAARKASAANVRGRDTRRAPTEPLGTMDDTMREVLANRKARAH